MSCRCIDSDIEGPSLLPGGTDEIHTAHHLINTVESFVAAGLDLMAGTTARSWGIGKKQTSLQRSAFESQLALLQNCLDYHGGPFLVGQQISLADLVYYPFARRFEIGLKNFCDYDIGTALDKSIRPWLSAMRSRQSCTVTCANDELLLQAYGKHMCLDFFDYMAFSVFQLHPQNISYLSNRH